MSDLIFFLLSHNRCVYCYPNTQHWFCSNATFFQSFSSLSAPGLKSYFLFELSELSESLYQVSIRLQTLTNHCFYKRYEIYVRILLHLSSHSIPLPINSFSHFRLTATSSWSSLSFCCCSSEWTTAAARVLVGRPHPLPPLLLSHTDTISPSLSLTPTHAAHSVPF